MMNFPKPIKYLAALLLAGFISPACADNWYQVEVIVFAHRKPNVDSEMWLKDPGRPNYAGALELSGALIDGGSSSVPAKAAVSKRNIAAGAMGYVADEPVPFLQLSKENFRLQGVYRVLKRSPDYTPLRHVSWQQPALETRAAKAVHLSLYKAVRRPVAALPPELAAIQMPDPAKVLAGLGRPIFDGFVRVRSSLFLHVDVDLNYFPAILNKRADDDVAEIDKNIDGPGGRKIEYVRLKESRKIKLNEMHYFDHPMFGVIVRVSRLQAEVSPN